MSKNHTLMIIIISISLLLCACTGSGGRSQPSSDSAAGTDKAAIDNAPVIVIDDTNGQDHDHTVEEDISTDSPETSGAMSPDTDIEQAFYADEISDDLFARMQGKSFPEGCTTPREDLRYLHLLCKDIDGNTYEGEMVCNTAIADTLIDIFRQLYEADYPIEKMRLIDDYDGDDDASMADNNTSCFNFRVVEGTTNLSKHALGAAVDINPLYNPYIKQKDGQTVVSPEGGEPYADRSKDFDYKIDEDDLAYKLFTEAGFTWGGSWKTVKDYQHFQVDLK